MLLWQCGNVDIVNVTELYAQNGSGDKFYVIVYFIIINNWKIEPHTPAILLLVIYRKELKSTSEGFSIIPVSLRCDVWIKKMLFSYTMTWHSATERVKSCHLNNVDGSGRYYTKWIWIWGCLRGRNGKMFKRPLNILAMHMVHTCTSRQNTRTHRTIK